MLHMVAAVCLQALAAWGSPHVASGVAGHCMAAMVR
jgi:hypothetical protein